MSGPTIGLSGAHCQLTYGCHLPTTRPTHALRSPTPWKSYQIHGKSTDMYFWGHNCGLLFYGLSLKIFQMHIQNKTIQEWEHIFQPTSVWQLWAHHAYHYIDVIMTTMASQITSLTVVYSIIYSDADQRKHQNSASLAFVWGIHRDRWIPHTKGQLRGKCFHLMTSSCYIGLAALWPEVFAIWLVAYIIKMSHPSCSEVIAIKFCTWHDSCIVVACAKFCSDMIPYNGVTLKPIFHQIWITMGKFFVKWVPGYDQAPLLSQLISWVSKKSLG